MRDQRERETSVHSFLPDADAETEREPRSPTAHAFLPEVEEIPLRTSSERGIVE